MNLQALVYFYETAQHQSINQTANLCFVSASSLSRSLSSLEKELNTTLFERTHTGIELTRAGKELFEQLKPSIEHLKQVLDGYDNGGLNWQTLRLRICAYQSSIVSQALVNFYQRYGDSYAYSDVIFDTYPTTEQVLEQMETADYMLGMIHFPVNQMESYQERLQSRGYVMVAMPELRGCITVRKHHPLTTAPSVTPEQLSAYPRVAYIAEDPWELLYCSDFHNFRPKEVKKRILVKERGVLHDLLRNTDAYFVGINSRQLDILDGTLVGIPVSGTKNNIGTLLFYRERKDTPESMYRFIEEVQRVFARFAD